MKKRFNDKSIGKFQSVGNGFSKAQKPKFQVGDLVGFRNGFLGCDGTVSYVKGFKGGTNEYSVTIRGSEHLIKEFNMILRPLTRKVLIEKEGYSYIIKASTVIDYSFASYTSFITYSFREFNGYLIVESHYK